MNINKELEIKSEIVFEVTSDLDVKPSVHSRGKILQLLAIEDLEFFNLIKKKKNNVFTYGDKFFAPTGDSYICIPKDCSEKDLMQLKKLNNNSKSIKEVVKHFRNSKGRFKGYFDIS